MRQITLELADPVFARLASLAAEKGESPELLLTQILYFYLKEQDLRDKALNADSGNLYGQFGDLAEAAHFFSCCGVSVFPADKPDNP